MQWYSGELIDLMQDELSRVMTINDVMKVYDKTRKAIQVAIWQGRLYAEKRDADEGVRGGTWLISQRSADALWGTTKFDKESGE